MADRATFLHLTDAHLSAAGVPFERDDRKVDVPGIENGTRGEVLELLFRRLAERLTAENRTIDAVLFSGDAQSRGAAGGHELVLQLVTDHLGIAAEKIVSVPGNHDVPQDAAPGSPQRYDNFSRIWRDHGCVVPWLDGIDMSPTSALDRHRLVAADRSWAVYPVNTSNWSHVTSVLPKPLRNFWDTIPDTLAAGDTAVAARLKSQLQALARYDMARVSEQQLEALRTIVASTPQPDQGRQLRIAVMHHHLRSPSLREELKPFADMSNLEQVRAWLRGSGIGVVIHGHKHEHAAYFDHIYAGDADDMHRVLVISGATFEVGRETDALRLITLEGLPHTPEVKIEPIPLPRSGAEDPRPTPILRRLWTTGVRPAETVVVSPGSPVTVEGTDLDEVYARALAIARTNASRSTLIVHLDLPDDDSRTLPLPAAYAVPDDLQGDERQTWLRELVEWWQLDRSQLEPRIPYLHGARLRRYGGKIDQIERIIALLRAKPSTRAVAVLVDPFRDFAPNGAGEEFASFCLVEFRRRDADAGRIAVDAIAFYRAQEFERWWPINIAEVRFLQREICEELGYHCGRITTIAADARTISRSPTQVAMPIVDRWLDQAPERLHLLADALVHKRTQGDAQVSAVREWRRSLGELRNAAQGFNADGIPVAIEGLLTLAAYIEATSTSDDELSTLARNLSDLARVNETFEHSTRSRASFNRWSPVAQSLVTMVERLTDERLPAPSRSASPSGV